METVKNNKRPPKSRGAEKKSNTGILAISGVIVPAVWDENGRIEAIALSTNDEDEYLIEDKGKGAKLRKFLRQEVEVTGDLSLHENVKTIRVAGYRIKEGDPGFMDPLSNRGR